MHPLRQNPARIAAVAAGLTADRCRHLALVAAGATPAGAATTTTTTVPPRRPPRRSTTPP